MRSLARFFFLALVALGCSTNPDTPDRAFRAFVAHLQAGEVDEAWELLSERSQDELSRMVHERSVESGGAIPDDPKRVARGDVELARPIDSVEVQSQTEDRATLLVKSGEESMPVQMVREKGKWKVALVDERGSQG